MADYVFIGRMAYNEGSQVVSALNSGTISVAVNNSVNFETLDWCATCGVCNEYVIMVNSYFMSKTDIGTSQAICYCTGSLDHEVLLDSINKLSLTKSEGPFTTLEDAMGWVESNGLFITNQNYPPIITNGNVLHLDGGLPASYPMVGTSWYDLTGNENNGILNNGVTYNSSLKGYLEFNGTNQYVSVSGNTNIPVGNSNYTIGIWFKADSLGDKGLVGWGNYGENNEVNAFRLTPNGLVNYWWENDLIVTTTITSGDWYYAVATFDGTTRSIYVNGSLVDSDTPTGHNVTTSSNLTIGVTNSNEYFDGSIGDVQIFDRSLTNTEVLQNYQSFVTRYDGSNTEICLDPIYCNSPTPTPTPTLTPTPTPVYSGVCNTYYFGVDTFPGDSTRFGYYEYPSGVYTEVVIISPDAIFANAYSSPGVFYVSGSTGNTIENYGPCNSTPTPTPTPTKTPAVTPTPTPTNAGPIEMTMITFGTDTELEACADIVTGEPLISLTTRYSTNSFLNPGDTIYNGPGLTNPLTFPIPLYYGYTIVPGPLYAWAYVGTDGVVISSGYCS